MSRADKLSNDSRPPAWTTPSAEMRRLAHVDLLIIDDFALQGLDAVETCDF
jgi:DNA replication protein DnaC